jgi:hypothetical protein
MNIDAKIPNKIMANQIQQYIKKNDSEWPSWLHPRDAGVVQHMQIYKCNKMH